jgi:hypothetical protein
MILMLRYAFWINDQILRWMHTFEFITAGQEYQLEDQVRCVS